MLPAILGRIALFAIGRKREVSRGSSCHAATLRDDRGSQVQNFVAWTACLVPDAVEDYSTVLALAEKAVATDPENDLYQKTLAATRFRAGVHDTAVSCF